MASASATAPNAPSSIIGKRREPSESRSIVSMVVTRATGRSGSICCSAARIGAANDPGSAAVFATIVITGQAAWL